MDLSKLFGMQRELDERIVREKGLEGQNLLPNKILALQVELGELANEWRGFKFWSNNQKPNTLAYDECPCGTDYGSCDEYGCEDGLLAYNPLLEEYVDCLHFILSIGLELGMPHRLLLGNVQGYEMLDDDFIALYDEVQALYHAYKRKPDEKVVRIYYESVFEHFLALGKRLGFTWEQVEEAYMKKNAVNHHRQESGY